MTFKVEVKGLERLVRNLRDAPENLRDGFDRAVSEVAYKILATSRALLKSQTGWLAGSGYVLRNGPVDYTVAFGASYAAAVEKGSKPHLIYPRQLGGVLRFEAGGQIVFTRGPVHHPGTWPQNYLEGSLEYWKPELLRVVKENLTKWIKWSNDQG